MRKGGRCCTDIEESRCLCYTMRCHGVKQQETWLTPISIGLDYHLSNCPDTTAQGWMDGRPAIYCVPLTARPDLPGARRGGWCPPPPKEPTDILRQADGPIPVGLRVRGLSQDLVCPRYGVDCPGVAFCSVIHHVSRVFLEAGRVAGSRCRSAPAQLVLLLLPGRQVHRRRRDWGSGMVPNLLWASLQRPYLNRGRGGCFTAKRSVVCSLPPRLLLCDMETREHGLWVVRSPRFLGRAKKGQV